jgi:hypothetical protein
MALATREIPPSEWKTYFDDFSRDLETTIASVEVTGPDTGDQIEAERLFLTGISYDDRDDIVIIGLDAQGGVVEEVEHLVYHPQKIYVASGEGTTTTLDIEDSEGHKTLVSLEPAG